MWLPMAPSACVLAALVRRGHLWPWGLRRALREAAVDARLDTVRGPGPGLSLARDLAGTAGGRPTPTDIDPMRFTLLLPYP
ncbi:hypothetical protein [Protofrankia symbiont of Coriaria ruscifolia]|uniref:hypothetical protein n=1 Tax=Protofrankia symbiont of Coriaria ruscifolia TaxID=1306542 RepID=UPI001A93B4E0|nr:hypothetical protein [Protofrankia symbiont of Coriaria ruscifolia]